MNKTSQQNMTPNFYLNKTCRKVIFEFDCFEIYINYLYTKNFAWKNLNYNIYKNCKRAHFNKM